MLAAIRRLFGGKKVSAHTPAAPVARGAQSTDSYFNIGFAGVNGQQMCRGTVGYRVGPDTLVSFQVWEGPSVRAQGFDLFEAFISARKLLETEGFIPLVAGARLDHYPSGMARNMGEGDQIYRLTPGQTPALEDLCFIFDDTDANAVGTVAAQQKTFERWANSLPSED